MKFFVFDPETKKDFGISQFPTGANRNIAHTVLGGPSDSDHLTTWMQAL
jgi:hypothetical protein